MNRVAIMAMLCAGVIGGVTPSAKADEWDQKTVFTFREPVEIPGRVLPAGTYVFKLADSQSDRNIVQVFSKNEKSLYGTFLAIPDYRLKSTGKPVITFEERAAGSPEAVRAWFYPGDTYGHQFVYPKAKALELARANNQPVPSMPTELAQNTTKSASTLREPHIMALKNAPLKAQKPTAEEATIAEVFVPAPPSDTAPAQKTSPGAPKHHASLPKTGSALPLIAALGLISLAAAGGLRLVSRQSVSEVGTL